MPNVTLPLTNITVVDPGHTHTWSQGNAGAGASPSVAAANATGSINESPVTSLAFTGISLSGNVPLGGSATAFSRIQPTVTINYIIKVTADINAATTNGVASIGGMTGVIICGTNITCTGNTISASIQVRQPLTVNTSFLINKDTGVDFGSCIASACATSAYVMSLIANSYDVKAGVTATIQYGCTAVPCTYTQLPFIAIPYVGAGTISIVGDPATPDNFVMHLTSVVNCVFCLNYTPGNWLIHGFKIDSAVGSGNGAGIFVAGTESNVLFGNIDFGAMAGGIHVLGTLGGQIANDGSYTISGGAAFHAEAADSSTVHNTIGTITLTGTPAFSTAVVYAHGAGAIVGSGANWSGAATGTSCFADELGLVDAVAASLPGSGTATALSYGLACGKGSVNGTDVNSGVVVAAVGGTGNATQTAHSVLLGEGTGAQGFATIGTAGRVLTDQGAGADPTFAALPIGSAAQKGIVQVDNTTIVVSAGVISAVGGGGGGISSRIFSAFTSVGNGADTTEDTLQTYTLPASTLAVNGQALRIKVRGQFSTLSATKTIRVYFGATVIATYFNTAAALFNLDLDTTIMRASATTQTSSAIVVEAANNSTGGQTFNEQLSPTETLSGNIIIKVTGQSTVGTANAVTCDVVLVEFLP